MTPEQQMDRAMLEDDLLTLVIGMAHALDHLAYHIRNSRQGVTQGDPGYPDLVLGSPDGHTIVAELKDETGKLSLDQERWRAFFLKAEELTGGGLRYYVWRPSDWRLGHIERALRFLA